MIHSLIRTSHAAHEDPLALEFQKLFSWAERLFTQAKKVFPLGKKLKAADEEDGTSQSQSGQMPPAKQETKPEPVSALNISLNIHGGSKTRDLYFAAIGGIVLQFGMLVFSGFTVYHPRFRMRFPKGGNQVRPYAFPIMAVGTITLMCGMLICSAIIEQSTKETEFVRAAENSTGSSEKEPARKANARILWLQKRHVVSDQTFDSFVIFGRNKHPKDTLDRILISRRMDAKQPTESTGTSWIVKYVASNTSQAFTLVGVFLGLAGFILQFQVGLKAIPLGKVSNLP